MSFLSFLPGLLVGCNSEPSQEILLGTTRGPPKDCGLVSRGAWKNSDFGFVSYITEAILEI